MSSVHNDLHTWAARARKAGNETIYITIDIADKAADLIVEQANRIADLEHELRTRPLPAPALDFTSDDDALELLKTYGHEESQNGVIRGDWQTFDEKCRTAAQYLINEWDFVFENVETATEPDHEDDLPAPPEHEGK
jgi:hypothetical protein